VIIGGMTLPPEFENELQNWLNARLDARLARERAALLTVVVEEVKSLLREKIWHDAEARGQELEQEFARLQGFVDQMQKLIEKLARLDRAAHNEPVVDSVKMN
jgi:type II secretory pathway component PulM